jgi:phage shock protein A
VDAYHKNRVRSARNLLEAEVIEAEQQLARLENNLHHLQKSIANTKEDIEFRKGELAEFDKRHGIEDPRNF